MDIDRVRELAGQLLDEVHPGWRDDAHTKNTPERWARWWDEFLNEDCRAASPTSFVSESVDQMVVVSGISVWSLCAHHLLPFSADLSIGYIPRAGRLLGLSKFARIARAQAQRLSTQESLVEGVAERVLAATGSADVAVEAHGVHLCMAMRGVRQPAVMTTSITRGAFREQPSTRAEWFSLLGRRSAS